MLFSPQIPLQLEPRRNGRFEDFVAGPNTAVVEAVRSLGGEGGAMLFLHGPAGSGKTHLLNATCLAARECGRTAFLLGLSHVPADAEQSLKGLESVGLVCIDDLHLVAGQAPWEEALFHLINRLREAGGSLAVTSRQRLSALPLGLPDLASRLAWGLRLELAPLEDDDKRIVLRRQAEALGIDMPDEVADYLLRRGERNVASLAVLVERLQHVAFTEKRRVTVPLARRVLQED